MSDARLAELAAAVGLQLDWQDANGRPQRVDPRSSAACWKHSAIRRRVRNRSNRAWPRWPGCARTAPTSDCWSANAASRWSKRSAPPAPRANWSTRTARGSPCAWTPKAACRRRPAAAMRSCRWSSGNGRWRWRRRAVRPLASLARVARVAGARPGHALRRPGDAAWATAPPSRTCCAARAWCRRAGDQPAARPPRPTDMPTAPTRRPAGCSSMSCTPRRRPFSALGGGTGDPSRRPGRGDGPPGEPGADRLDSGGGPAHAPAAPTPPRLHRARQSLRHDLAEFRREAGEALLHHCRFETPGAPGAGPDWRRWPEPLRRPGEPAVAAFCADHAEEVDFRAFGQWLTQRCLQHAQRQAREAGMAIGLVADLAVGADGGGSQAWSRQEELLAEVNVGAPPDILNQSGQDWGVSAFNPEGLRRHGYRAFREMLRANLAWPGGLRIDHAMGLQRLWLIPRGQPPHAGAYLRYPQRELLRLLALEASRASTLVIGEDLGTVPEGLREELARRQVLGTRVLLFERRGERFVPPAQWPADAMATTSTHDLPSLSGWWRGQDIHLARPRRTPQRRGMRGRPGTARRGAPGAGRQPRTAGRSRPRRRSAAGRLHRLCRGNPRAVGATAPGGRPGQPGAAEPARPRRRPPELAAALAGKRRADARNAAGRPAPAPARTQPPGCRGGRP